MRTKDGLCSGCWKKVEETWLLCPYCEKELAEEKPKRSWWIRLKERYKTFTTK